MEKRSILDAAGVTVFATSEGRTALKSAVGPVSFPVAICSIPKAGTYLLAGLLEGLGLVNTEIHAALQGFSDYRGCTLAEKQRDESKLYRAVPLRVLSQFVAPGQFFVGHLPCTAEVRMYLEGFRLYFIKRDLRDALVSHMRFFAQHNRGGPRTAEWKAIPDKESRMLAYLEIHGRDSLAFVGEMEPWQRQVGVLGVSFEELQGDAGPHARDVAVRAIAQHVGLPDGGASGVLKGLLGQPTLTWSGRRTDRSEFWGKRTEEFFRKHGGNELNVRLGYPASG